MYRLIPSKSFSLSLSKQLSWFGKTSAECPGSIASRRNNAPWWSQEDCDSAQNTNQNVLKNYFEAKVAADEFFVAWAEKRKREGDFAFQAIDLRPGNLTDDPATGKVLLGKTPSGIKVSRADVAHVAVQLLARDDTRGYYDLLGGSQDVAHAVEKVVREKSDSLEGEDLDRIYALVA